jgi:putative sterol carrier protein
VQRRRLAPPAGSWVYELTSWGEGLEEIVVGLARWVHESPRMRYDLPLGTDSLMLAVKTLFDGRAAADVQSKIALSLEGVPYWIRIDGGELTMARGEIADPDITIATDNVTMLSLLHSDLPVDEALAAGVLQMTGNRAVLDVLRESVSGARQVTRTEP